MAKLEIIGFPISTYVRAVRMLCEEKGLPYTLIPTEPHKGEVAKIHPYGKVPVMRHGKTVLFESLAIATYIERKFDGKALFPTGAAAAAETMQWLSFVNAHVYPTMIGRYVLNYMFAPDKDNPDRAAIEAALPEVEKQAKVLDAAIARNGMLAARGLTFADLNLMGIVDYTRMFPEGGRIIAQRKHLSAWYDKLAKRKSWKVVSG